jgi:hypothetical protein
LSIPGPRIGERIDVVDPEQPSLHQILRKEIPRVLNDVREEDDGHPVGCIVSLEAQAESAEEALHTEEGEVSEEVEGPEASGGTVKSDHEIDDDVVDEEAESREG